MKIGELICWWKRTAGQRYQTEKDRIIGQISDCLNGLESVRYHRWNLGLFGLVCALWFRWRLAHWFNCLDRALPAEIKVPADNLHSSDLYLLSRAASRLLSRKRDVPVYLEHSKRRAVIEQMARERAKV
ncbi:MAG: hypothetical protein NTY66_04585 [Candidatus Vogelbacteria bacterium]|nr:hypothetical protein [Candidatus Vogelbacteria bacterium]